VTSETDRAEYSNTAPAGATSLRLSRDLYTNVASLRTRMRKDAAKWRQRTGRAVARARRDVAECVEPEALPNENAFDAVAATLEKYAETLEKYAETLDLILSHEEQVTTMPRPTHRRRGVPGA